MAFITSSTTCGAKTLQIIAYDLGRADEHFGS